MHPQAFDGLTQLASFVLRGNVVHHLTYGDGYS